MLAASKGDEARQGECPEKRKTLGILRIWSIVVLVWFDVFLVETFLGKSCSKGLPDLFVTSGVYVLYDRYIGNPSRLDLLLIEVC